MPRAGTDKSVCATGGEAAVRTVAPGFSRGIQAFPGIPSPLQRATERFPTFQERSIDSCDDIAS